MPNSQGNGTKSLWTNITRATHQSSPAGSARIPIAEQPGTDMATNIAYSTVSEILAGASGGITQLTGDVTAGPGSGSQVATIANNVVTNAKLATMATQRIKGRTTAGTGNVEDLTAAQALAVMGFNYGIYLPVASSLSNVNSVGCNGNTRYFQVGDIITVCGLLDIQATATGAASFNLTLPFPSNFANSQQANGTFADDAVDGGRIWAFGTGVQFNWIAGAIIGSFFSFQLNYQLIP